VEPSEAGVDFWEAAKDLYWEIEEAYRKTQKCVDGKAPLATYEELRAAFLPTRTKETVEKACDKVAKSAEEMFANSEVFAYGAEPSCSALGLDEKSDVEDRVYNRCSWFKKKDGKIILTCDCPDGYGEYEAKDYAKEHAVKCYDNRPDMHYSDYPEQLAKGYRQYEGSKIEGDVSGMVIGCDAMINALHGSGPLARFFVKSGKETLDKLLEAKE